MHTYAIRFKYFIRFNQFLVISAGLVVKSTRSFSGQTRKWMFWPSCKHCPSWTHHLICETLVVVSSRYDDTFLLQLQESQSKPMGRRMELNKGRFGKTSTKRLQTVTEVCLPATQWKGFDQRTLIYWFIIITFFLFLAFLAKIWILLKGTEARLACA